MKIITNNIYPEKLFIKEKTEKEVIILQNFKNYKEIFHYVIVKDGTIYELIDPDFWFTTTLTKNNLDKKSISIGLENEGSLTKRSDGKFYYRDKVYKEYKEPVFENEILWKDEKYFSTYKEVQLHSLINLLQYLFEKYPKINKYFSNTFDYHKKWYSISGIIMRCNLDKNQNDLTIAFPIERFERYILKSQREEIMNSIKTVLIEKINILDFKKYNKNFRARNDYF